jgi:shikimate dehydrogenase
MRVGLIGNPVEHSRSPRMHNAAFAALGMPHTYELWHTGADEVGERVAGIRAADIAGANVTVPHKEAVIPYLDEISPAAQRIGAVNTIIPQGDRLVGDNTDAYGFRASIEERYGKIMPKRAVVLGAGGASRAVIVALQEMGASEVLVANRTLDRAVDLAGELNASPLAWQDLPDELGSTDVLVNATALGWHDEVVLESDLVAKLPMNALVMDLTYRHTPLLQSAQMHNLRGLDGLGMLIHQGVRSFELWFGITPPLDVMTTAARND